MRRRVVALWVGLVLVACGAKADHSPAGAAETRWPVVRALASDELAGRAPGSAGSEKARALIVAELERCGVAPPAPLASYLQPTDGPGVNVLGHLPGSEPDRYVLLSAHYDHLGVHRGEIMNGADDNAAAVGSVLAVACALAKAPRKATLVVALWDAEEPPHFLAPTMGSRYWVEHPHVPLAQVEAAIVLDLVGGGLWPGSPLHVALGAESSPALARIVDATAVPEGLTVAQASIDLVERLVTGQHQPWSDYHYLRKADVPFVFLSNGQSEHYHQPTDDFATLDLDKLDRQTTWLAALVRALLDLPAGERPRFEPFARPEHDRAAAAALVTGALGSGAFDDSREVLERDLTRIPGGDPKMLRAAVQRVQCLAIGRYPRSLCHRLGQ